MDGSQCGLVFHSAYQEKSFKVDIKSFIDVICFPSSAANPLIIYSRANLFLAAASV